MIQRLRQGRQVLTSNENKNISNNFKSILTRCQFCHCGLIKVEQHIQCSQDKRNKQDAMEKRFTIQP